MCLSAWCVTLWLPTALIATMGGLAGLAVDKQRKGMVWLISLVGLGVGVCMLFVVVRNRFFPEPSPTPWPRYHIMDEQLKPFVSAINEVDPISLGFSPIPANAWVEISPYPDDIYIFVSDDLYPSLQYFFQQIYFQKVGNTYKWVGEEEYHRGPSPNEKIVMKYWMESSYGYPNARTLVIEYTGEDFRLKKSNLTPEDIRPILAEWEKYRLTSRPSQ
jgi:hypothetical protein